VSEFRGEWESLGGDFEIVKRFGLGPNELQKAVDNVVQLLGMRAIADSHKIADDSKHTANLRGKFITGEMILARAGFMVDGKQNVFLGGRLIYDYVAGYVRMDSWNAATPYPGINGISIWDLRENPAVLTMIGPHLVCQTHKMTRIDDLIPSPPDYSLYKFDSLAYWNRAMAEKWVSPTGDYVYTNVFSRAIVGMGSTRNVSDPDSQALDYVISDWTDKVPAGTSFDLPGTVKCSEVNATESFHAHLTSNKRGLFSPSKGQICNGCKKSMVGMVQKMCNGGDAGQEANCAKNYPTMAFCPTAIAAACSKNALTPESLCRFAGLC